MKLDNTIKNDLKELAEGSLKIVDTYRNSLEKDKSEFIMVYQTWFTQASRIVKTLVPERSNEFDSYYRMESVYTQKGEKYTDERSYTILDYILGTSPKKYTGYMGGESWSSNSLVEIKLINQIEIINSINKNIDNLLFNLNSELHIYIQDKELNSAKELLEINPRAAGVLVGVILNNHLNNIVINRNLDLGKERIDISDINDVLKNERIIDTIKWRKIQYLNDIINSCSYNKEKEPEITDIDSLITGVNDVIKSVF